MWKEEQEMRWGSWKDPQEQINLRGGSGGKITAEETLKEKRREQQEAIWCLSEKCLWVGRQGASTRKETYIWSDTKCESGVEGPAVILKSLRREGKGKRKWKGKGNGEEEGEWKIVSSGNKCWQTFKEWHCARRRFGWTQWQKWSDRKKNPTAVSGGQMNRGKALKGE